MVNQPKHRDTLHSYEDWVILNSGNVQFENKQFTIPVRLAPAGWHIPESKWASLGVKNPKKGSAILNSMVRIEEYETLVPGTIISNTGEYKGIEGELMEIEVTAADQLENDLILQKCVPSSILEKTAYVYKSSKMPVYKIEHKGIIFLLPKSEVARYYFFAGSEIIKVLSEGRHDREVDIPGFLLEDKDQKQRIAIVKMEAGYSKKEKIVLAQIAVNARFHESADYIYRSIYKQQANSTETTFLQAKLFQNSSFVLGTTGIFLDPAKKYFFINQIHQTKEMPIFTELVVQLRVDPRQIADEDERQKLDSKKYKPKGLIRRPSKDVNLEQENEADFSSDRIMLQNGIIQHSNFFDVQEVTVTTAEKLSQDKRYEAEGNYKIIVGGSFTTNSQTSSKSTSLKAAIENIPLIENELNQLAILGDLPKLVNAIKADGQAYFSGYFNNTDSVRSFQELSYVIDLKQGINIVVLSFEYSKRQFYIFDLYYRGRTMKRTQILHRKNYGIIGPLEIELLIQSLAPHNYSWFEAFQAMGNPMYVSKGFNHRAKNQILTISDVGKNINSYIIKRGYSDQERI